MDAWEGLAFDDDVLESFLKKCDASSSLLPGSTGNVQAAFLNRTKTEEPKSTQEFAREVAQATHEQQMHGNGKKCSFNTMVGYLSLTIADLVIDGKFENVNPLNDAKSLQILPFVACIVKECKPNGLGDMQLTIKDPTTTMKASLHKKVLEDPQFGQNIGVGSVFYSILVHSFRALGRIHYLNIVHRNVVKVFPTEICPPTNDLVKETPKPVIRLPLWAENNVDVILRKFVPPSHEP
ncbi:uncharacterized protein HKW66_Vig0125430 [Vigna angularis]|uniref:Homologous recombination OB-fold protein OB-fold domain-containing protein n=1 Tax=Phaseolus angularis TaxID=3914 RepID=A0A8T0K3T9_PHAAN|nr:uncharacterized protein HKW66_Vig0125430 [Vigna angularis]